MNATERFWDNANALDIIAPKPTEPDLLLWLCEDAKVELRERLRAARIAQTIARQRKAK